jgi:hypothetical protein
MARHTAESSRQYGSSEQGSKMLSRRIHVMVKRDMTSQASATIWQHEKPILEALFGAGEITEIDSDTLDEGYTATIRPDMLVYNKTQDRIPRPSESHGIGFVFVGNAEAEYERLGRAFGRLKDEKRDTVEVIYGRFAERRFSELLGKPTLEDLPENQLRSMIFEYGYAPLPHKDASADEKNAVFAQRKELAEAEKPALIAIAQKLGVQIG